MAKKYLSAKAKEILKKKAKLDAHHRKMQRRNSRERGDCLIYVPEDDFLPWGQKRWISSVNRRECGAVSEDIVRILDRYLDIREKNQGIREEDQDRASELLELVVIAKEITQKMSEGGGIGLKLEPNPRHSPTAKRDDPFHVGEIAPFFLIDPNGPAGVYMGLARFLSGEYGNRLKRCFCCSGLFIAPSDRRFLYCPGTGHKDLRWQKERSKS
jgi:hypothetical protein